MGIVETMLLQQEKMIKEKLEIFTLFLQEIESFTKQQIVECISLCGFRHTNF